MSVANENLRTVFQLLILFFIDSFFDTIIKEEYEKNNWKGNDIDRYFICKLTLSHFLHAF